MTKMKKILLNFICKSNSYCTNLLLSVCLDNSITDALSDGLMINGKNFILSQFYLEVGPRKSIKE